MNDVQIHFQHDYATQSCILRRKESERDSKSPFYCMHLPTSPRYVLTKPTFKEDVEEYLGGPDAEVETPLKAFQDALAYESISFLQA